MQKDRILPFTKWVAAAIVPFLLLAFLILFFFPETSGERFAWEINPSMTAMFMGAGYVGGAWLFINTIFGQRWHRVAPGFPAVTTFATAMLLATVLHWEVFDLNHLPAALWFALYVAAPILVPIVWWRNRSADPSLSEQSGLKVPAVARWGLRLLGIFLLGFAVLGFVSPNWLIDIWPWPLSALTARIMSGWFALLGVGGVVIGGEVRWSGWKVGLESIGLWQVLVLIAAFLRAEDFQNGVINWYTLSVAVVVAGMIALYLVMEMGWISDNVSA
ncbi:MAG: hypothetical protein ACLFWD_13220 [Anaerolineales bacterium]